MEQKRGSAETYKNQQKAFEAGVCASSATDKEITEMAKKYDDPQEKSMFLEGVKIGKQRSS